MRQAFERRRLRARVSRPSIRARAAARRRQDRRRAAGPPSEEKRLASVSDFLAAAKAQFGFVPKRATEPEFKRKYAIEALKVGLTKDQVVRVYALETGGMGTYDMQSGINPVTRQGRPISSALGYAQLLHANSVGGVVKHGDEFVRRLLALAAVPGTPADRVAELKAKAVILRKMIRAARTVPNEWSVHQRFANTPPGLGIHAINMDADLGPWLQVLKLKGLLDDAAADGRAKLTGAETRADEPGRPAHGPRDDDAGRQPHADVELLQRGRLCAQPRRARQDRPPNCWPRWTQRMEVNIKKPGSIEFGQIFDEVARGAERRSCSTPPGGRPSGPAGRPRQAPARMRAISGASILTSGGRTCARGRRPSSTSASFMRLCMSTNGSA